MSHDQEIITSDRKCIGCMKCAEACGTNAISFIDGMRVIDWECCNNCMECASVCPSHALEAAADYMSIDEADILESDNEIVIQSKELLESYGLEVAVGG